MTHDERADEVSDYIVKGYTDWPVYTPPNHPQSRAAYDHGWQNRQADSNNQARLRASAARAIVRKIQEMPDDA